MVGTHNVRHRALLALTGDAVLRASACLAASVVRAGALARTASNAAGSAIANHIITLLALNPELRVRCASAVHTGGAIGVRLLAG